MQTYRTIAIHGAQRVETHDPRFETDSANLYRNSVDPQKMIIEVDKSDGVFALCRPNLDGCNGSTYEQQLFRLGLEPSRMNVPTLGVLFCSGASVTWFTSQEDNMQAHSLQGQVVSGPMELHLIGGSTLRKPELILESMLETKPRLTTNRATSILSFGVRDRDFRELSRGSRTFF